MASGQPLEASAAEVVYQMPLRSEAGMTDVEFASAMLELHQVRRHLNSASFRALFAESQSFVAKAGTDNVELMLHVELSARHFAFPRSLQSRVGES